MSTITTILSTDAPKDSRAVINTNFSNLNADKIETSVLDTDGTLAANSDTKVATQQAVKEYVDTQVATNSTPTILTYIPRPNFISTSASSTFFSASTNTTARICQFFLPAQITVNKLSFKAGSATTPGTVIVSIFSEDGQTRHISVTSGTVNANVIQTVAVSAVALDPGNYYITLQPVGTTNVQIASWIINQSPTGATSESLLTDISGEPKLSGEYTVSAGTAPSTITPTSITEVSSAYWPIIRLDN